MVSTTRMLTTDSDRRQIFHQIENLVAFNAYRGLDLIAGDDRARIRRHYFDLDAKIDQLPFDQPGSEFQRIR